MGSECVFRTCDKYLWLLLLRLVRWVSVGLCGFQWFADSFGKPSSERSRKVIFAVTQKYSYWRAGIPFVACSDEALLLPGMSLKEADAL